MTLNSKLKCLFKHIWMLCLELHFDLFCQLLSTITRSGRNTVLVFTVLMLCKMDFNDRSKLCKGKGVYITEWQMFISAEFCAPWFCVGPTVTFKQKCYNVKICTQFNNTRKDCLALPLVSVYSAPLPDSCQTFFPTQTSALLIETHFTRVWPVQV